MKNKKLLSLILVFALTFSLISVLTFSAFAAQEDTAEVQQSAETTTATDSKSVSIKAIAAAAVVAVVATAGALGMAAAICKSADGMARQPEAAGKINSAMMLGLVFIETAIIYALIVAILVIFVL